MVDGDANQRVYVNPECDPLLPPRGRYRSWAADQTDENGRLTGGLLADGPDRTVEVDDAWDRAHGHRDAVGMLLPAARLGSLPSRARRYHPNDVVSVVREVGGERVETRHSIEAVYDETRRRANALGVFGFAGEGRLGAGYSTVRGAIARLGSEAVRSMETARRYVYAVDGDAPAGHGGTP